MCGCKAECEGLIEKFAVSSGGSRLWFKLYNYGVVASCRPIFMMGIFLLSILLTDLH